MNDLVILREYSDYVLSGDWCRIVYKIFQSLVGGKVNNVQTTWNDTCQRVGVYLYKMHTQMQISET